MISQHWSARSPLDTNATMWSGFHVKSNTEDPAKSRTFMHFGDTGCVQIAIRILNGVKLTLTTRYSPTLFAAIGRVFGPVDLAAIPIGSYEPRWHMHLQHTDPEGAVRMAIQMGIAKSVGVHWGTWLMSDEACEYSQHGYGVCLTVLDNKPPVDLAIARKKLELADDAFCVLPVGQTLVVEK